MEYLMKKFESWKWFFGEKPKSVEKDEKEEKDQDYPVEGEKEEDKPEQDLCCICYENLKDRANIQLDSCKHSFHTSCGLEWISQHNTCPLCRDKIQQNWNRPPPVQPLPNSEQVRLHNTIRDLEQKLYDEQRTRERLLRQQRFDMENNRSRNENAESYISSNGYIPVQAYRQQGKYDC